MHHYTYCTITLQHLCGYRPLATGIGLQPLTTGQRPFTHTFIYRWRRKPYKAPTCSPGAARGSESCSRTLRQQLIGAPDQTGNPSGTLGAQRQFLNLRATAVPNSHRPLFPGRYQPLATSHRPLAIAYRSLVLGHWPLATGCGHRYRKADSRGRDFLPIQVRLSIYIN